MESEEAAPLKARFNLARLQISGGVKFMKTQAKQPSGMSPNPGVISVLLVPSVRLEREAPMKSFLFKKYLVFLFIKIQCFRGRLVVRRVKRGGRKFVGIFYHFTLVCFFRENVCLGEMGKKPRQKCWLRIYLDRLLRMLLVGSINRNGNGMHLIYIFMSYAPIFYFE